MLTIREEQMEALKKCALDPFVSSIPPHLRVRFPDQAKDWHDRELRAFVEAAVNRARFFAIRIRGDVMCFVEFVFLNGLDCLDKPQFQWARSVLEDPTLDGTEKMNYICEYQIFSQ